MSKDTVDGLLPSSECCYIPNLQSKGLAGVPFAFHYMQLYISGETE